MTFLKAFESEESFDVQMNEIREMENEIVDLESHLKLLNDALEDEKQENYKLAQDNAVLRKQVILNPSQISILRLGRRNNKEGKAKGIENIMGDI